MTLRNVVLPSLTLAIAMSAKYLRQVRAAVLEELGKAYVAGAKARGVRFSVTLTKSVLRSCLVTILTLLTLSIGSLLGGTAIVESIFMWDGVGKLAVRRHQYAGLSDDSGLCDVDGDPLCLRESRDRPVLSGAGSPHPVGGEEG